MVDVSFYEVSWRGRESLKPVVAIYRGCSRMVEESQVVPEGQRPVAGHGTEL